MLAATKTGRWLVSNAETKKPPVGTRVVFSVFPNRYLVPGVVVEGGIEVTDPAMRASLQASGVSVVCGWDDVDDWGASD